MPSKIIPLQPRDTIPAEVEIRDHNGFISRETRNVPARASLIDPRTSSVIVQDGRGVRVEITPKR